MAPSSWANPFEPNQGRQSCPSHPTDMWTRKKHLLPYFTDVRRALLHRILNAIANQHARFPKAPSKVFLGHEKFLKGIKTGAQTKLSHIISRQCHLPRISNSLPIWKFTLKLNASLLNVIIFLTFSFLIYKMKIIVPASLSGCSSHKR